MRADPINAELTMVGMSGGVDSAVTALLLKQQGRPIAGLFMKNWEEDGDCRAEDDRRDALAVCANIGIRFHAANFAREYRERVFAHFLDEIRAGRTPNPDVLCNREIKFRRFLELARAEGAARIATGHYARCLELGGRFRLLRGRDGSKDQSYFLYTLGQDALAVSEFPLGDLLKSEVRALAYAAGIPVHAKKDSTGICFIGERNFREFLSHYLPTQPGEIRDVKGSLLGRHCGVFNYTLGQREGLHIGGVRGRVQAPWYVVAKDVRRNLLFVDQGHESRFLQSRSVTAIEASWTAGAAPAAQFRCTAKTRYRQRDEACTVSVLDPHSLQVRFASSQRAVTPGQSIVFYDGDECLGGGVIEHTDAPRVACQEAA